MKKLFSLFLFILFIYGGTSFAQESRTITLQEAIEIALENNYQLKQAKNNLDLADKQITSEYADFLPNISSSLSYGKTAGQQFIQDQVSFSDVTSASASGRISASISLFDGFNNINTLRQSEYSKLSNEEQLERAKENVIFNTASAYLSVLVNTELLEIAEDNLETSKKQLEQTKAQVEVGSRPSVDLYTQESAVATNELNVIQRENQLRLSKVQLIRQLQIDPLIEYEFEIPEIAGDYELSGVDSYHLSELIDDALLNRSDLKSEVANIRSQEFQLKIAKGSLYPSISANATLSTRWSDRYFLPDATFSDQFFDQQVNKGFGFSFNLPIFQNWNRIHSIQSAKIQLKNSKLSLENSKLGIIQEVTQAYNDYIAYQQQLESSRKALTASEKAFETQQERYKVGASTLIELSQTQSEYVSAQSDYTQAQYNLIFQEKLLDYFLGKLNKDTVKF
ncbi:MAG: TolC family protein [Balneolaceae bacterium]|nr:TolC family protein [Balneolaceae bacterium]